MIASLRGKLIYTDENSVIIECGGVGYKCFATKNTLYNLPKLNSEIFLYTHMVVREDAMDLYGFSDLEELSAFKLLISVSGVGAKIGIALLSQFTASQIMLYIGANDPKSLTAASGVGLKLAQRIVLELKDKVGSVSINSNEINATQRANESNTGSEAVAALVALGYSKGEASLAVGRLDGNLPTDQLIKQALKIISRGL